jgi:hypothetical protein
MAMSLPRPISSQKFRAISNLAVTGIFTCVIAKKVIEAGLAGHLLGQKPEHVFAACGLRQPRKEGITLTGPCILKLLEPIDEVIDVAWCIHDESTYLAPNCLDVLAFSA